MSPVACSAVRSPLVAQDLVLVVVVLFLLFLLIVVLGLDVQNHLQRFLVHGHLRLQARQVEVILDEILRHLGEVLVAEQAAEGRDPRLGDLRRRRHGDSSAPLCLGGLGARRNSSARDREGSNLLMRGSKSVSRGRAVLWLYGLWLDWRPLHCSVGRLIACVVRTPHGSSGARRCEGSLQAG
ncbi:hypothetical protein OPT61_g10095 [Boeremia exigua]|uniref:Uncharacterized protein n=1 Tax=Boeremia exigua TaxID=749465 RepID=A0ACC2HS42_9PLEO|nr:hypothetical protein OPT61_g10095 [Boeremia exigua]